MNPHKNTLVQDKDVMETWLMTSSTRLSNNNCCIKHKDNKIKILILIFLLLEIISFKV